MGVGWGYRQGSGSDTGKTVPCKVTEEVSQEQRKRKAKTVFSRIWGKTELGPVPFSCALMTKVVTATVGAGVPGPHSNEQSPPLSRALLGRSPLAPQAAESPFPALPLRLPPQVQQGLATSLPPPNLKATLNPSRLALPTRHSGLL